MKNLLAPLARKSQTVEKVYRLSAKTRQVLRTHGLRHTSRLVVNKVRRKLAANRQIKSFETLRKQLNLPEGWSVHQMLSLESLQDQRSWSRAEGYRPTIQLLLPIQDAAKTQLQNTIQSLLSQTYDHWKLCIICHQAKNQELSAYLNSLKQKDKRISVLTTADQDSWNSLNRAIQNGGNCDYVGVIREGDKLTQDGLFQIADKIVHSPETDVLYTDEAHVNFAGDRVESFLLKPDWSPEMLLGYNYLGSLSVVRKSILQDVGGFQPKYKSAQEWDLNLRLSELDCKIRRVARCCYIRHNDNAPKPQGIATPESEESYRNVLADYVSRHNLPAKVEANKNGTLRLRWQLSEHPLVSIIIPNKNSPKLIKSIVHDLVHNTDYPNKEIIIVDNQSDDPEVLKFYEQQQASGTVQVTLYDQTFNYSAACNTGARAAKGEILLFLNNDIEVCSSDWLDEMVGWAIQDEIAVVGTKLVYPNGAMQHCGVVIGPPPIAGLIYHKAPKAEWGIFGTQDSYRNYLSVIGACQMIRRDVFDELNGYDENYLIASSDTAFCLRASKAGYRIVYTPFAELIHHEGLTRGKINPIQDIERLAREIREMAIWEDPYHHPLLGPSHPVPTLRGDTEPSTPEILRHDVNHYDPDEETFLPLDWTDYDSFQASIAGIGAPLPIPLYSPPLVSKETTEAAKFIIHVLLRRDELRAQFPFALSEGKDGAYCRWLCEEGLKQYHIPEPAKAAEQIREAFDENPGSSVRQLYTSFRPDLRAVFPTALLPTGQRSFLRWLLTSGRREYAFQDEQIFWFLKEAAELPAREFEMTYKTSQHWQQWFPAGLTRFGRDALLEWAKSRHRLSDEIIEEVRQRTNRTSMNDVRLAFWSQPSWQKKFPEAFKNRQATKELVAWLHTQYEGLPTFPDLAATMSENQELGLNVLGHFCYPSGLQQSVKSIVQSLHEVNIPSQLRDVPAHYQVDGSGHADYLDFETYDVSLVHSQPSPNVEMPYEDVSYNQAGLEPRSGVYRIGYWYWELEDVPSTWKDAAKSVDELWAPTKFIADAMKKSLSITVTPMTPGMELGQVEKIDRRSIGVADDEFMFLYMFDVKSYLMRKNPMAVIESFKRAFRKDDRVKLVIKVSSGDRDPKNFGLLKKKAEEVDAVVIDKVLSRGKSYGLIDACDCYTSLHRSEGLGLTMAEAMMMSKPVIGTRYSGNLDFMSDSTSLLVDYRLVPCQHYVHKNFQEHKWADPSVDHAAECMRWVYDNQDEAKAMGERAKVYANQVLSPKAAGERIKARLQEIYAMRNSQRETSSKKAA